MQQSRYTDSQVLAILKHSDAGISVVDSCREHGMSDATFDQWRARYGGMDASLMKRMKVLEDENRRLMNSYAEEKLKAGMVREAMEQEVKPFRRRKMAPRAMNEYGVSIRVAGLVDSIRSNSGMTFS